MHDLHLECLKSALLHLPLCNVLSHTFIDNYVMPCPCGLSRREVLEVAEKHNVPILEGTYQNPLADGTDGICGNAIGAHPVGTGPKLGMRNRIA